jgi:hypothetical protein
LFCFDFSLHQICFVWLLLSFFSLFSFLIVGNSFYLYLAFISILQIILHFSGLMYRFLLYCLCLHLPPLLFIIPLYFLLISNAYRSKFLIPIFFKKVLSCRL